MMVLMALATTMATTPLLMALRSGKVEKLKSGEVGAM
jgi:hypothetical protein